MYIDTFCLCIFATSLAPNRILAPPFWYLSPNYLASSLISSFPNILLSLFPLRWRPTTWALNFRRRQRFLLCCCLDLGYVVCCFYLIFSFCSLAFYFVFLVRWHIENVQIVLKSCSLFRSFPISEGMIFVLFFFYWFSVVWDSD